VAQQLMGANKVSAFHPFKFQKSRKSTIIIRQVKGLGPTVFKKKKNGQRRYKYIIWGRDKFYAVKYTLILPKNALKRMAPKCSSLWLTTYLLRLVNLFLKRQTTFLCILTVLPFSPACSFIRTRYTSYRGFSRKTKKASPMF
jgi:hypothetical protein